MVKTAYDLPVTTFTWCPTTPILATGSYYEKSSQLELFQLGTDSTGIMQKSIGKVNSSSRFTSLAWGNSQVAKPWGMIAAGTDSGGLELWDPHVIIDPDNNGTKNAFISQQTTTYTQSIFYMDFNLHQSNLLVTAGRDNEVFIWDLANYPKIPYTPGAHTTIPDVDLTKVAWNCQVPYILSTCFSNGQTSILDLRSKKKVMELTGKHPLSSVVWHPDIATQLVTAAADDAHSVVTLWDLRRAHTPEKTMNTRSKGILDLSWCRQDSELLVSSGKDGNIFAWNPRTGLHSEIAKTESPTQIEFCPRNPNWLASASLTGEIHVWPIRSTSSDTYNSTSTSNEHPSPIKQSPKWLRRPVGASFGFGGKLVMFFHQRPDSHNKQQPLQNVIHTTKLTFITDNEITRRISALQYAKIDRQMLLQYVDQKCQLLDTDEHWFVLKILFAENAREQLIDYLGLDKQELLQIGLAENSPLTSPSPQFATMTISDTNAIDRTTTLSGIFRSVDNQQKSTDDDFFSSTNVSATSKETKTSNHWLLLDQRITQSIATGDFDTAVSLCMEDESRMADALLLAISGGPDLFTRTRQRYLERQTQPSYMQLLDHLIRQDLMSFVQNSHVDDWKLVLAVLCTFAASDEFGTLCEALGLRLETAATALPVHGDSPSDLPNVDQLVHRAAICYIVSGKLERLLPIWISGFEQNDKTGASYTDRLQCFMEKATVFLSVIDFEDPLMVDTDKHDTGEPSLAITAIATTKNYRWMDLLYRKYCEYADLLATNGQLDTSIKYLGLVPESYYEQTCNQAMAVIRDRIYGATTRHGMVLLQKKPTFPFGTNQMIFDHDNLEPQSNTIHLQQTRRLLHQPSLNMLQPRQQFFGLDHLNANNTRDSTSDTLFMTARDIPDFENINANRTSLHQEKYFFDSFTSKTESPTSLDDNNLGKPDTTEEADQGYLDMQSMGITSPMTLQSSDTEGTSYFEKGIQLDRHRQQQQQQRQQKYMDTPTTPPNPETQREGRGPNKIKQPKQRQEQDTTLSPLDPYQHSVPYPTHQHKQDKTGSPQQQQKIQKSQLQQQQQHLDDSKIASPMTQQTSSTETHHHTNNIRGENLSAYQHRTSLWNPVYKSPQGQVQEKRRYSKEPYNNIKQEHQLIYQTLYKVTPQSRHQMESVQKKQWEDIDKRLDNLFQQLNDHNISDSVAKSLLALVEAFIDKNYEQALNIQMQLVTTKYEECSNWLLALRRIIDYRMGKF